jgi:nicotinamidase-related amidase
MKALRNCGRFLAGLFAALSAAAAIGQSDQPAPPKTLKAEETAIILVDFQANFVHPEGAWYGRFKPIYDKTRMLERTVELVKAARAKGVWVIHVTEGYSQDYRELDWTNPGAFHRNQILRKAWKIGSKEAAYYEPLKPGANDRDLFLPPRIQASGFGGTGLNEILRSKGIRNVAVGGFTTDVCVYATVLSAYDLGYRVYALREAMAGFYPEMSEQMLGSVYTFWSSVIGNDDWLKMVEPAKQ